MSRMGCLLVICFLESVAVLAQPTAGEERIVRTTYARMTMASQVGSVREVLEQGTDWKISLAAHELTFTIQSVDGGDLFPIAAHPVTDFLTLPEGDITNGGFFTTSGVVGTKQVEEHFMQPAWEQAPKDIAEKIGPTLDQVAPLSRSMGFTRYATVRVTATLIEKSRTYDAMFLFRPDGHVYVLDMIAGTTPATWFAMNPAYPRALMETSLRLEPVVAQWLAANSLPNDACAANARTECCDMRSLRCGIAAGDVEATLAEQAAHPHVPLPRSVKAAPDTSGCAAFDFDQPDETLDLVMADRHLCRVVAATHCAYIAPVGSRRACRTVAITRTRSPETSQPGDGSGAAWTACDSLRNMIQTAVEGDVPLPSPTTMIGGVAVREPGSAYATCPSKLAPPVLAKRGPS